jgi:erythromycin esterase-like protein
MRSVQFRAYWTSRHHRGRCRVHSPLHRRRSAADLLLRAIGDHRVVLLGELHGTRETPALAGQLLAHFATMHRPVLLGLEITRDEQDEVDRYLASTGSAEAGASLLAGEHWSAPHDGRDSQAMLELIKHARQLHGFGVDVRIIYFDARDADMNVRNRRMADTLRAAAVRRPGAILLVLTGNVHAMTHQPPSGLYGKPIESPMTTGRYLSGLDPLSVDINAARGEYWACISNRQCRRQAVRPQAEQTGAVLGKEVPTESAWDYSLVVPRFHASTPAIAVQADGHAPTAH